MAFKATQETLNSLERAEFLSASIRTHKGTVTPKVTAVYGNLPSRIDGTPWTIDFDHVQESNAELLDETTREAREKAHVYRINTVTLSQLRGQRSDQSDELRGRYRNLGKSVEGSYGKKALSYFGLDGPAERAYTAVREQCANVATRMRRPDLLARLGGPLPGQIPLEFEVLADGLETAVQAFEKVTSDITEMQKVKDESLVAKNEALARQRRVLANVARVQEGYFRIAGLDDLADRIRVTIPRRSAKKADDTTPEEPSDDAPAAEPATDDAPGAKPPQDTTP